MSRLTTATRKPRQHVATARATPRGVIDPTDAADRVSEALALLGAGEALRIGSTGAKRLLGLGSENTVIASARLGLLRRCALQNGRARLLLDDVLRGRAEDEAWLAIGGDDLTPDGLRRVEESGSGSVPW